MTKKKFYVTTPIYYTSGKPHLGHAYTSLAADVIARWKRITNFEVFFLTGTDEHGQKVQKKADEAGISPQQYVDSLIPKFKKQLKELDISFDYFIRTTDEHHKKFVQRMLQKAYDNGDIYKDEYEGLYCVDCEQYFKEDDLLEGNVCPVHKKEVDSMKEENYFFKLSKYEDKLLKLYKENSSFLSPESKSKETINRVEEGLQDISISRRKETLSWGIELPFDKEHVTYVWFDALFNYVSALEYNDKLDFWPADVHILGKDIMWFHNVYWPAFLMSCGYEVPKKVFSHGWWTVEGEKMGKAMGNVLDPIKIAREHGVDEFRYFTLALGTFGEDQDYSDEKFAYKINNELNNDFGNLVSRVHAMTNKYFEGIVPEVSSLKEVDKKLTSQFSNLYEEFNGFMEELQFNRALEVLWNLIRETNAYVNEVAPWKEEDKTRLGTIMNILVSTLRVFATYTNCFMPTKTQLLRKQYNFSDKNCFDFSHIENGHVLGEKENLFSKIKLEEKKKEEKSHKEKPREGFSKLNLKVGKILSVKQHPEAEKLYIETIDVGEEEPRQIISGLKDHYSMDDLLNRKVIVVANLKPAKLRGEKSYGMVLLAEDNQGNLGFLETDAEIGTNLSCGDELADNPTKIKIDNFFEIKLESTGDNVVYNGKSLKAGSEEIKVENKIKGEIR